MLRCWRDPGHLDRSRIWTGCLTNAILRYKRGGIAVGKALSGGTVERPAGRLRALGDLAVDKEEHLVPGYRATDAKTVVIFLKETRLAELWRPVTYEAVVTEEVENRPMKIVGAASG